MYSGRVLVGFWFDKLQIESEKQAKHAEREARGELPHQREERLLSAFLQPTPMPTPRSIRELSKHVNYGQPVLLQAPEVRDLSHFFAGKTGCPNDLVDEGSKLYGLTLAATASPLDLLAGIEDIKDGCGLACVSDRRPEARSVFEFVPATKLKYDDDRLRYGREFFLRLANARDKLYLRSEPPLVDGQFGPNYHYPVRLSLSDDAYAKWRVLHWNRRIRFETEGDPVPPCARIVIQHVMTNQCLAAEQLNWHRSLLGFECGVSVYTYSDVHRNECSECIWSVIVKDDDDDNDDLVNRN